MNVTIYTTTTCGYCNAAKSLLQKHGFSYEEVSLDDLEAREKFKQENPGLRTIPQIYIDGEHVGGYTDLVKRFDS